MKLFLNVLLLSTVGSASAMAFDSQAVCQDIVERRGSIQVQMIASSDGENCYVSVHNRKSQGLIYRDYLFTADGELMVFNSLGYGDESKTTGAREFFFFPRINPIPTFEWNDEIRRLIVTTVNGNQAYFDYEDAELVELSGAEVKRAAEIRPDNRGGVEINKYQGLKLDSGFRLGAAPTGISGNNSVFTDKNGKTCSVKNYDLFKYTSDGDIKFKFSDTGLRSFLKSRCSSLTF